MKTEAIKQIVTAIKELNMKIKSYGTSTTLNFSHIIDLSRELRDSIRDAEGMDAEDRYQVFELLREAKLLAITQPNGEHYLSILEKIEDDIRRVA